MAGPLKQNLFFCGIPYRIFILTQSQSIQTSVKNVNVPHAHESSHSRVIEVHGWATGGANTHRVKISRAKIGQKYEKER